MLKDKETKTIKILPNLLVYILCKWGNKGAPVYMAVTRAQRRGVCGMTDECCRSSEVFLGGLRRCRDAI